VGASNTQIVNFPENPCNPNAQCPVSRSKDSQMSKNAESLQQLKAESSQTK